MDKIQKIYTRTRLRIPKFSNNLRGPKENEKILKILKLITVLIIAFSMVTYTLKAIEPIMDVQCKNIAKSIATKVSNSQATNMMSNYDYNDFLKVTKDANGNIKMVETNVITVNKIISEVPVKMQEDLEKETSHEFSIRMGSLLGGKIFAGRGPKIPIKIETIGNVETTLFSDFKDAGINQTFHRIYLQVKCQVIILTPYHTIEEKIVNQVLLAEDIIVGEVPESYYNLNGITTDQAIDMMGE